MLPIQQLKYTVSSSIKWQILNKNTILTFLSTYIEIFQTTLQGPLARPKQQFSFYSTIQVTLQIYANSVFSILLLLQLCSNVHTFTAFLELEFSQQKKKGQNRQCCRMYFSITWLLQMMWIMRAPTPLSLRAKLTRDLATVTCPMQPLLLSLKGFRSNFGLQQPKKPFPLASATPQPTLFRMLMAFRISLHTHTQTCTRNPLSP